MATPAYWLTCPHRSPPFATITGRVAGCGCSSSTVEVYECQHFHEPVLKQGHPPCPDTMREKIRGWTGRTCRECPVPRESILTILHVTHKKNWQDQVRRSRFALQQHGIAAECWELPRPPRDVLLRWLAAERPKLVTMHGFPIPAVDFLAAVERNPGTTFVAVDHSSLNHTFTWPSYFSELRRLWEASQRLPNLWVAAVDRHAAWADLGYTHYLTWANPVYVPQNREPQPVAPPTIIITGRVDWMKGLPAQITAAALLQRRRPDLRVLISWTDSTERQAGLREHAAVCGLRYQSLPYADFDEWHRRLREEVSIVLQPSMSDSMNYVTLESCLFGRPFVGSATIPHCPRSWRVTDPNDTGEIMAVTESILSDYHVHSRLARQIADEVTARNNTAYSQIIGRLLNGR